jgi:hypothetical protein
MESEAEKLVLNGRLIHKTSDTFFGKNSKTEFE